MKTVVVVLLTALFLSGCHRRDYDKFGKWIPYESKDAITNEVSKGIIQNSDDKKSAIAILGYPGGVMFSLLEDLGYSSGQPCKIQFRIDEQQYEEVTWFTAPGGIVGITNCAAFIKKLTQGKKLLIRSKCGKDTIHVFELQGLSDSLEKVHITL